jgi:diacylglycerol kinase (ATP)
MEQEGSKSKLAIIPGGTGNDIARNAGIFSVADAVSALHARHTRVFDLLRVDCQINGGQGYGYSFLFGNVGFSAVPMIKSWMKRALGAKGAYYLGVFLQILAYRAPHMTVRTEDQEYAGRTYMVVAGNAEWCSGGSMRISPGALTDDGELNIIIVPSLSKFKVITKLFSRIATGEHINTPGVSYFPGRRIEVYSNPSAVLDLDGDLFGTTPATFTICPRSLRIICPQITKQEEKVESKTALG